MPLLALGRGVGVVVAVERGRERMHAFVVSPPFAVADVVVTPAKGAGVKGGNLDGSWSRSREQGRPESTTRLTRSMACTADWARGLSLTDGSARSTSTSHWSRY